MQYTQHQTIQCIRTEATNVQPHPLHIQNDVTQAAG